MASTLSGFFITGKVKWYCAESLYNNIIEAFQMRNSLYEEGESLIWAIFKYIRDGFKEVMESL